MGGPVRGQGGCEWRSEAFVKIQKKKNLGGGDGGLGQGGRVGGGDQGGWEQRSEACVKIKKKNWGGQGGGGFGGGGQSGCEWRSGEACFCENSKKKFGGGGAGGGGSGGVGLGVRVDGTRELKLL